MKEVLHPYYGYLYLTPCQQRLIKECPMRLDKYISQTSDYSRSEAKRLLRSERVTVDGELVSDPRLDVDLSHEICIDDYPLPKPGHRYFMLNKPEGVVSATKDGRQVTALSLLDEANLQKLHIAGRLDQDSTGLLLITDDGQWSHKVTSPRHDCQKRYRVETEELIPESAIQVFANGILLSGETKACKPAELLIESPHEATVLISEGRFHQVKRMFESVGCQVTKLHRDAIGAIELDETLMVGDYRPLTPEEIGSI